MNGCDVRGCPHEGVLALSRKLPDAGGGFPKVVLLRYCAEHYGAANRFHRAVNGGAANPDRDRRPVQANA